MSKEHFVDMDVVNMYPIVHQLSSIFYPKELVLVTGKRNVGKSKFTEVFNKVHNERLKLKEERLK